MAASPNIVSYGAPMILTKDEATAAQRTWPFYLSNSADGTPATGKTIAGADFKISKAGGALANAVGAVTELTGGWYKIVFDAGDVDTLGALACDLSVEAGVDPLRVTHQVTALDLNVATVNPGTGGIVAASFAAGAIDAAAIAADAFAASELGATAIAEIQAGLATGANVLASRTQQTVNYSMGNLNANESTVGVSASDVISAVVTMTGTWDGATVTLQECADPLAAVPVWTTYAGGAKTANGQVAVTGPVRALRATMSSAGGSSSVDVTIAMIK